MQEAQKKRGKNLYCQRRPRYFWRSQQTPSKQWYLYISSHSFIFQNNGIFISNSVRNICQGSSRLLTEERSSKPFRNTRMCNNLSGGMSKKTRIFINALVRTLNLANEKHFLLGQSKTTLKVGRPNTLETIIFIQYPIYRALHSRTLNLQMFLILSTFLHAHELLDVAKSNTWQRLNPNTSIIRLRSPAL
jgi:hypothetical protein